MRIQAVRYTLLYCWMRFYRPSPLMCSTLAEHMSLQPASYTQHYMTFQADAQHSITNLLSRTQHPPGISTGSTGTAGLPGWSSRQCCCSAALTTSKWRLDESATWILGGEDPTMLTSACAASLLAISSVQALCSLELVSNMLMVGMCGIADTLQSKNGWSIASKQLPQQGLPTILRSMY